MAKRSSPPLRDISPPPLRRKTTTFSGHEDSLPDVPVHQSTHHPDHMRIFSWNVNGVGPFLQKPISSFFQSKDAIKGAPAYSMRGFLKRHEWPQMLCLQEVKINPRDDATKRALERAANIESAVSQDDGPRYIASYCLPKDKYNARGFGGKVYGVATLIRDDFREQHVLQTKEVEWDLEGRVLITELDSGVAIINGYWVNGTTNPYKDSETGEVKGNRHDRKRVFHTRMLQECLSYEGKGWSVVLVGDMNISRCELDGHPGIRLGYDHVVNRANFNSKFFDDQAGMRAVDAFRHVHGAKQKYTYYGRSGVWGASCDRVDLIMLSRKMVEEKRLVYADILNTPEERGHSDHVPIYVTLDLRRQELREEQVDCIQ